MIMFNVSKYTKPHSPFCNQTQNRRMVTIVAWALYLSTAICWQEPELLFSMLFTLAVSRNNRFLHASLPSPSYKHSVCLRPHISISFHFTYFISFLGLYFSIRIPTLVQ